MAEFIVRYRAIVYRPFKGETVDGVVGNVNKVLIEPFLCLSKISVEGTRTYADLVNLRMLFFQMGFFAEVGPLNVFVSSHVRNIVNS